MPVKFDLVNPSGGFIQLRNSGTITINNLDFDLLGSGQSVTFSVSSAESDPRAAGFLNQFGPPNVTFTDQDRFTSTNSGNNTFILTYKDGSNDLLSGTVNNPIALEFGTINGYDVELLSENGAVLGSTAVGAQLLDTTFEFVATGVKSIKFTSTSPGRDVLSIASVSANELNCFVSGTQISTPTGQTEVQELAPGDVVETADGRHVEVKWVGHQFVDTQIAHPAKVNPVCISAGALGEDLPERDLFVSPDHALALDGVLVTAGALVNDNRIYQVKNMPRDGFTYYHIETDAHELLLAEACPVESFLDYSDTFGFDNSHARADRVIAEMPLSRISSRRLLPDTLAARLRRRADATRAWRAAS